MALGNPIADFNQAKEDAWYSKPFSISRVAKRTSSNVARTKTCWKDLKERLKSPTMIGLTMPEFLMLSRESQTDYKDQGGYVGGEFEEDTRKRSLLKTRTFISLDADTIENYEMFIQAIGKLGCAAVIHSTIKHTAASPRMRLVIPLMYAIDPEKYEPLCRVIAQFTGMSAYDRTTFDPARLMFWPTRCENENFVYYEYKGPLLDPDGALQGFYGNNWMDIQLWPRLPVENEQVREKVQKVGDPRIKSGIIGAFCRAYTIDSAIAEFLPKVYLKGLGSRYTYHAGSCANGLCVFEEGTIAFSHHGTDPASGRALNAYDMVRIHKFGHSDKGRDDGEFKPDGRRKLLPSEKLMNEWAENLPKVKYESAMSKINTEVTIGDFDTLGAGRITEAGLREEDWQVLLKTDRNNNILNTFSNAVAILRYDREINKLYRFNEFTDAIEHTYQKTGIGLVSGVDKKVPIGDMDNGELWTDDDNIELKIYLSEKYSGLYFKEEYFNQAVRHNAMKNAYHPIKTYLDALEWDGVERLKNVWINYMDADVKFKEFIQESAVKWFVAGVGRVYEPGLKFDNVVILLGKQGCRKSTFCEVIAKRRWCGSLSNFSDQKAMEQIKGSWIVEMAELKALEGSQHSHSKAFISARGTKVREAYGKMPKYFARNQIFIGTSNDHQVLRDPTGNRRFWPIDIRNPLIDIDKLETEVDQLWAEAVVIWKSGQATEKFFQLSPLASEQAVFIQASHCLSDEWQGIIEEWLKERAGPNRYHKAAYMFPSGVKEVRDRCCIPEIWEDCLGNLGKPISPVDKKRIVQIMSGFELWEQVRTSFGSRFGNQMGWKLRADY